MKCLTVVIWWIAAGYC